MSTTGNVQEVRVYLKGGKSFSALESHDLALPSGASLTQVQGGSVVMPGRGGLDFTTVAKVLAGDPTFADHLDASQTKETRDIVVGPVGTKVLSFKAIVTDISLSGKVADGDATFTTKWQGKRETLKAI